MRITAALLLLLLGCAPNSRSYAHWPYRGPMMEIHNAGTVQRVVLARDGEGRVWPLVAVGPNRSISARWPFIHAAGALLWVEGRDTLGTKYFEPWTADCWSWIVGDSLPTVVRP